MYRIAALFLLGLFLTGCNSYTRVSATEPNIEKWSTHDSLSFADDLRTSQSAKAGGSAPINVLSLSGGSWWGAWGAGYLTGWKNNPQSPRPERFDVVTGISTGGLQATAAFIGDDEILSEGFTQVDQADVMRNRFPPYLSALWSPSLYDTQPLWKLVQKLFTNAVIDKVADVSHGGDRRLIVAACELDSGDLVFWDLSKIARSRQYDLYRSVCLATAAIPGAFPPVNIGGKLYVDGGTRASLFVNQALQGMVELRHDDIRVYVIVNGQTKMNPIVPTNRALPVAFRAVSMVLAAQAWGDLRQAYEFAKDYKALFWLSYVPDDYVPNTSAEFDRTEMNRLFDLGKTTAEKNVWASVYDQRPHHEQKPYFATPAVQQSLQGAASK